MAWPFIAMAALSAVQGFAGNAQAEQNADAAEAWGIYNASIAKKFADFNADSIERLAAVNSALVMQGAETNALVVEALAQYNATLRVQTAEYDAQLLEKEAALVWEAQELDQEILAREAEIRQKTARATFASSGVEINTGSPVEYTVDQATQANLEAFVIRHNADVQMGKLLDAAALSRWQGEAEAAAMIYEAQLEGLSIRSQGALDATQINVQGAYDAVLTRFSGTIRAEQIISESQWEASQYRNSGNQSLLAGLFQGASWASKSYGSYHASTIESPLTTPTSTPSSNSSESLFG